MRNMTIKGKRIFNYRPLVVFAVALVLGIILGEAVYSLPTGIIIVMCFAAFAAIIPFICIKKVRKFFYIPLALLIGMVSITASNSVYDGNMIQTYQGSFTADVASEIIVADGHSSFYVSEIRINGKKLKYDSYVYLAYEIVPDFGAGDRVTLKGSIKSEGHDKSFNSRYASYVANGIGYFTVADEVTKLSDGDPKFPLNIQIAVKRALFTNTDEYTASVCQALLLGSKRGFNDGAYDDIAASGLAHVLAVSGLHITALASALYFVLKKLKVNSKISFIVVTLLTFFYSMLCGFTASSVRAVIMGAVLMFASAFGRKQDGLSSLSFAGILILFFRPTALMEVGFLLSFASVLGIFMFYKPFERIGLKAVNKLSPKRGIGTRFAKVCALSFATNLTTLPLVAYYFQKLPLLFVLSNFVVLPYMLVFFATAIIFTLLTLITTFGGFVFALEFLLYPFKMYVAAVGFLPFTTVPVYATKAVIVCWALLAVWLSKYVFAQKNIKTAGTLVGSSLSILLCLVCAL